MHFILKNVIEEPVDSGFYLGENASGYWVSQAYDKAGDFWNQQGCLGVWSAYGKKGV